MLLYNTLDYPAFGFGVERMKMAFRGAYAAFDKVAFLLNAYLKLGHPDRQVNFRNLWFVKGKGKALHPALDGMANWPLRGLFWLSKDIFEDDFREVTEPDAQALYDLRNHLEHKFVSVHDGFCRAISPHLAEAPKTGIFDLPLATWWQKRCGNSSWPALPSSTYRWASIPKNGGVPMSMAPINLACP